MSKAHLVIGAVAIEEQTRHRDRQDQCRVPRLALRFLAATEPGPAFESGSRARLGYRDPLARAVDTVAGPGLVVDTQLPRRARLKLSRQRTGLLTVTATYCWSSL